MQILNPILFSILFFVSFVSGARAEDLQNLSDDALILRLANTDNLPLELLVGDVNDFIGDNREINAEISSSCILRPYVSAPMREIVRRGVAILPALISHLTDNTSTQYIVGNRIEPEINLQYFLGYTVVDFSDEYDPKSRPKGFSPYIPLKSGDGIRGGYTLRVGDICYDLIGQIVGRDLNAARYQPGLNLVVNSPVHDNNLAALVRADWGNITPIAYRDFLLRDLEMSSDDYHTAAALTRLRYYFPEIYENLSGDNLRKKLIFESSARNRK